MLSRRAALLAAAAASSIFVTPAFTTETKPFTLDDFAAAQKAGKPIFRRRTEVSVFLQLAAMVPIGRHAFN